jgi:hypothetical protein
MLVVELNVEHVGLSNFWNKVDVEDGVAVEL